MNTIQNLTATTLLAMMIICYVFSFILLTKGGFWKETLSDKSGDINYLLGGLFLTFLGIIFGVNFLAFCQ